MSADVYVALHGLTEAPPIGSDAERILSLLDLQHTELSVVLCDDARMQVLNRDWRGRDRPTDVLAFPQGGPLLGDVIISVPTAARQAHEKGHTLERELRVLLVHGICHLLGHDHQEEAEAQEMEALERRLLEALGRERLAKNEIGC